MTARWLRAFVLTQAVLAVLLGGALAWAGHALAGLVFAVLAIPLGHGFFTGLHMILQMAWCHRHGRSACRGWQRWRAWLIEWGLSLRAFAWMQPWREWAYPDCLPNAACGQGQRGVVLIHGFFCNRAFWNPLLHRLSSQGTPFVAVNLEPQPADIASYADSIDAAVRRLHATTHRTPLLLAHSMGGLAARAWLAASPGNAARVAGMISLGSPHHGIWLASFANAISVRQMRVDNPWLDALRSTEAGRPQPRIWCLVSDCDQVVYPTSTGLLPEAQALRVSGAGHMALASHPITWQCLQQALRENTVTIG